MSADHIRTGPGATTWAGLAVVAASAAVLSFTALHDLAVACGITGAVLGLPLAALLPVAVDAAGVVATRLWLTLSAAHPARSSARAVALSAVVLSIAGNGAQHGLAAYGLTPPWWAVVGVSAVAPVALAAVAHLAALVGRTAAAPGPITAPEPCFAPVEIAEPAAQERPGSEPGHVEAAPVLDDPDLPTRIAALVEQAERNGERPPGRRRIAAALGTTEHAVRAVVEQDAGVSR